MANEDRSQYYDIGERIESRSDIRRFNGRVKSTGARVVVHEMEVDREAVPVGELFQKTGPYAALRDVRVPRLIDAWQTDKSISYVTLEQTGDPLGSPEARVHFTAAQRDFEREIAYQSLSALAALHDQTILHRHIAADCYVVTPACMVFMRYHGLDMRIGKLMEDFSGVDVSDMMLVANLYACDVCDWAAMISGILCKMPVLDPKKRYDDSLIPEQVTVAVKKVRDHVRNKAMADFLCTAMQARADSTAGFENAGEAVKAYPPELVP